MENRMKSSVIVSMRLWLFVVILVLFSIPFAMAKPDLAEMINHFGQELQGQEIPKPASSFLGDQKINLHILQNDGEDLVVGIVTEQGKIKNLIVAEVKDPTLTISTDEDTIEAILTREDKFSVIKQALDDKKLTYKAVGFSNKVKFWFAKTAAKAFGLFNKNDDAEGAEVEVFAKVNVDDIASGDEETNEGNTDDGADDGESGEGTNDASAEGNSDDAQQTDAAAEVEDNQQKVHIVKLIEGGFPEEDISIKVGETVQWLNTRSGRFKDGMIIGTMACRDIKSDIYDPGESYSYTFTKPGKCVIVDGIYTTETMDVIVS
ncbi:MAG TPA: hypothetical protein VJI15_06110 [Candidatus Nanoarchaeia archaeon]|nr:hypothetical protein [Candidatus Nanoarchaeia archaeon]